MSRVTARNVASWVVLKNNSNSDMTRQSMHLKTSLNRNIISENKFAPTIREAYTILNQRFEIAKSDAPQICARVLLMHVLNVDAVHLATHPKENISPEQWTHLNALAMRHEEGEPLAYIIGYKEFYGRNFLVNAHTLIPRPESEDVLDAALSALHTKSPRFVDVGTGSGCLGISLAAERAGATGILLDISADALDVAKKNTVNLGVAPQVGFVLGDLCKLPLAANSFDLIISNPPYVSESEYAELLPNVRDYEPKSALVPKLFEHENDALGLSHIKYIAKAAPVLLRQGGVCVIEHGYMQGMHVRSIFEKDNQWISVETGKDLGGLDRYCICKKV